MYLVRQWADVALFANPVHSGAFLQRWKDGPPDPFEQHDEPVYTKESFFEARSFPWLHPASGILNSGSFSFWFRFPSRASAGAVEWWLSDVVLANLADALRRKYAAERQAEKPRRIASIRELRTWVSQTRALARDAEIGLDDAMTAIMMEAADCVECGLTWPERRLSKPPTDTRRLFQLYTTAYVWCVNELLDAVSAWANDPYAVSSSYEFFEWPAFWPNTAGRRQALDRAAVIRWMLEMPAAEHNAAPVEPAESTFIESDVWKMRIKRLEQRLLPCQRDAMMSDLLDTLRVRPVDHSRPHST